MVEHGRIVGLFEGDSDEGAEVRRDATGDEADDFLQRDIVVAPVMLRQGLGLVLGGMGPTCNGRGREWHHRLPVRIAAELERASMRSELRAVSADVARRARLSRLAGVAWHCESGRRRYG